MFFEKLKALEEANKKKLAEQGITDVEEYLKTMDEEDERGEAENDSSGNI